MHKDETKDETNLQWVHRSGLLLLDEEIPRCVRSNGWCLEAYERRSTDDKLFPRATLGHQCHCMMIRSVKSMRGPAITTAVF